LMTALADCPNRKDSINAFFDWEIVPVPLAYADVFVSRDKGIRDVLQNRTDILRRNPCRYLSDLSDLESLLNASGG
jgi:hypothetical protein